MAFEENNPGIYEFKEDGDSITGILTEIQNEVGPQKSKLYTLEKNDEKVESFWGSTILDQRMLGIKIGSLIRVTYKGLGEAKPGRNPPKIFKVEVDRDFEDGVV